MKKMAMVVAALMLGACAKEYAFTPPTTPEGRACVERCQASQMACRKDQDHRADIAQRQCALAAEERKSRCDIQAPIEYAACLKFAKSDEERKACVLNDCEQDSCQQSSNYGLCDNDYRTCFQSCGGKIEVMD